MELFKLFGTIAIQNADANEAIDDTTDKASQSENKISSAFKKIGTAVATYFAVDKIKDFGLSCIDAASDANAASSQFSQVFGDMESQASKSLQTIADNTGIAENRMKGSYTQIAAFAKTTGLDTSDALGLADRAMVAVADSAAFYDRSLEETTESLQSFLKGNYENDAALGLSCTEITRNEAANRLYGKSFNDLSEAQKQLTLLQMVEDANKLSGAMGQASRESDTWTNQTGNLKQAWKDFQSILGSNILPLAVDVVKRAADFVQDLSDKIKNSSSIFEGFSSIISDIVAKIQAKIPEFVALAGKMMTEFGESIKSNLPTVVTKALDMIEGFVDTIAQNLPTLIQSGVEMLKNIAQGIADAIPTLIERVPAIVSKIANLINDNAPTILVAGFDIIVTLGKGLINAIPTLIENIPQIIQAIWDAFCAFNWINLGKQLISGIKSGVTNAASSLKDAVHNIFNGIKDKVSNLSTAAKNVATNIWNSLKSGVSNIVSGLKTFIGNIWNSIKSNTSNVFNGIKSIASTIWNSIKSIISGVVDGIKSKVSSVVNGVKSTISSGLNAAKNTVSNVLNSIKNKFSSIFESAKSIVSNAINKIKGFFNFSWSLPKIKLPHFSISGKFSLNPPSIPHFSVSWYKKAMDEPYMFTKPTLFDVNPATGTAKGAGEAGDEVMIGKDTMLNMIRQAVATEQNGELYLLVELMSELLTWLNNGGLTEVLIDVLLHHVKLEWEGRELARLVRTYA